MGVGTRQFGLNGGALAAAMLAGALALSQAGVSHAQNSPQDARAYKRPAVKGPAMPMRRGAAGAPGAMPNRPATAPNSWALLAAMPVSPFS